MKKLLCGLLSIALLSACTSNSSAPSEGAMKAGTYSVSAAGYHGDIRLNVTVDETSIVSIDVVEENETEGIGKDALPKLIELAINQQVAPVDSISGATLTSQGFNDALVDALTQAGANLDNFKASQSEVAKEAVEESYDVVVVGGGLAGLSSALTALQNGKSVVLIEKMGVIGGTSAMAGAGTMATGSKWQQEDGYEDSPEQLKKDMLANGHNKNDEATLDIFVNNVGEAFDWLVSEDGANVPYKRSGEPTRSYSAEGRGAGVVSSLSKTFSDNGGVLYTSVKADELIVNEGKVVGVKASSTTTDYTFNATRVILATGGYGANDELVADQYKAFVYAGAAGATGDAIAMVEPLNADLIDMDLINTQPNSMILPSGLGQYCNPGVGSAYGLGSAYLVNQDGVRFTNEQGNAWDLMQAMKENQRQYLVMDQASFDAFNQAMIKSAIYTQDDVTAWLANDGQGNPFMVSADSMEALAEKLDVPSDALVDTMNQYNTDAANGSDSYNRTINSGISEDGPYYALQMYIRYYASLGGLHINDQMQVLTKDQTPIEGLYAAGEVVGGVEGDVYMGATLFGWAMTSGHLAGQVVSQ